MSALQWMFAFQGYPQSRVPSIVFGRWFRNPLKRTVSKERSFCRTPFRQRQKNAGRLPYVFFVFFADVW